MTRRRRRDLRLRGIERPLVICGATLYLIGLFGGLGLLEMGATTSILLLVIGGGLGFGLIFTLIF